MRPLFDFNGDGKTDMLEFLIGMTDPDELTEKKRDPLNAFGLDDEDDELDWDDE